MPRTSTCISTACTGDLYYPTERVDDAYLASHIGGNEEDWDVIKDFNELFRGNKDAWNAMFAVVNQLPGKTDAQADALYQQLQGRNPDGTLNPALPVYLDMDNLIDYMISHLYAGVEDWPSHNWLAARNRVDPGTGFQFFTWDQEIAWDGRYPRSHGGGRTHSRRPRSTTICGRKARSSGCGSPTACRSTCSTAVR